MALSKEDINAMREASKTSTSKKTTTEGQSLPEQKGATITAYLNAKNINYKTKIFYKFGRGRFSQVLNKALEEYEEKHGTNLKFGL